MHLQEKPLKKQSQEPSVLDTVEPEELGTPWEGKSRGSVLGYRIYVYLMHKLGLRFAYTLLYPVVLYFCFTSRKNVKALFYYLHKRQGYTYFKSWINVYRGYYVFGQSLIDKFAIASGLKRWYSFSFDGREEIETVLGQKKGALLISAHVGNFQLSEFFFAALKKSLMVNLIVTDREKREIKEYLDNYLQKTEVNFILVEDNISHIFEINAALMRNEIVCISGDRFMNISKCLEGDFLGKKALFPAGPFLLGAKLNVPVLFVYVMRGGYKKYNLYAKKAAFKVGDENDLFDKYRTHLEQILQKYPLQWFNYYDFWKTNQ